MASNGSGNENVFSALSEAMAGAVEKAASGTVLVNARRRIPASGIAYANDLILTADHVVERDDDLNVILPDGSELSASVAGRDSGSDLALLRLERGGAAPVETAPDPARIGQLVLALGRPSRDGIQASLGVISAVGGPVRTGRGGLLENYFRTDAIPYPGFSGGPLIDSAGRVLGLNTSGLAHGASLVIPSASGLAAGRDAGGTRQRAARLPGRSQPTGGGLPVPGGGIGPRTIFRPLAGQRRVPAVRPKPAVCWSETSSSRWRVSLSAIPTSCLPA